MQKETNRSGSRPDYISSKRVFVGAAAVYDWYRDVEQPEVHRQLAAMVVPVVQHDGPHDSGARLAEGFSPADQQPPVSLAFCSVMLQMQSSADRMLSSKAE